MIVVTTPTGRIGSQLVRNLLAAGQAVRVIVRDPAKLRADVRDRVEVVEGSHGEAQVVGRAFAGADAVFWLAPADPRSARVHAAYVDFSRPACRAFLSQGVGHVVGVSSLGRGEPQAAQAGQITASLAMDDLIASTGVSYRALCMPGFMDNALRQVAGIKSQGVYASPIDGDTKTATCATRDIAAVAAGLLIDRSWSGFGEVPVLGPEDLSSNDIVRIMSDALGKPVRFLEASDDAVRSGLLGHGASEAMAQATVELLAAVRNGIYSDAPRTAPPNAPTTFREWCEDVLKPAVEA